MTTLADVEEVLQVLEDEERSLSRQRTRLHARIDFLHSGGYAHVDTATEMGRLRELERELSERRSVLHREIEAARRELARQRDAVIG